MTRSGDSNPGAPGDTDSRNPSALPPDQASVPPPELLATFERYPASERRYSPHTLTAYRRDLEILCTWGASQELTVLPAVRHHHIRHCLAQLHARGRAARACVAGWRRCGRCRFAQRQDRAVENCCIRPACA